MKHFWENDGEPLPEGHKHAGEYCAIVDLENGEAPSVYYGATHKAVADKLLAAQLSAANRIHELRTQVLSAPPDPARATARPTRRVLSADERMQVAQDMTDPTRAPEAIARVVEAEVGVSLATVRENMAGDAEQQEAEQAATEARAFAVATPEWYPTEHNKQLLRDYLEARGWGYTRNNFSKAFEALKRATLVQFKPETDDPAPTGAQPASAVAEPTPSATRPRGTTYSTGLRAGDATAVPGTRTTKYTRADIEVMSQAEFNRLLDTDAAFATFVRSLDKPAAAAR